MKKIKGILVDPNTGIEVKTIEYNDYKDLARLLKCDYLECVRRRIGNDVYDIYCDEEGRLKEVQIPTILTMKGRNIVEYIVNPCFICFHTTKGELMSLHNKAIDNAMHEQVSLAGKDGKWYQCIKCSV